VFVERMDEVVPAALISSDQTKTRKRAVSTQNRRSVERYGQEIKPS
jgi:hypothetical protein